IFAHQSHRLLAGGDDWVAADDEIGAGHADPRRADVVSALAHQDMAPGGAAFLRQPRRVLGDDALAFDVPRHAEQLADGDDAGAADTGDHDAEGPLDRGQSWLGEITHRVWRWRLRFCFRLELSAFDRDEAGAKALEAAHVLVAGALVDGALAPELRFQWLHRKAIAL